MEIYAIIGIIIAIVAFLLIIFINTYNKFQWLLIKINKAETNISTALEKKHNILLRYQEVLKNNIKIKDEDFDRYKLLNMKISINKLNKEIENMNNLIAIYMDNNEQLLKNEAIININNELSDINITINGIKKYYNDTIIDYNHLIHMFPAKIISILFNYKEKEFLDEDFKEELKILEEAEVKEEKTE